MPDDSFIEVAAPAEMIDYLTGQHIFHHRIDREITATRRFARPYERIHIHIKVPVTRPGRALASRHCDIDVFTLQCEDSEAFSISQRFTDFFKDIRQRIRLYPVYLYIHIFVFYAQQPVAHKAADIECPSAGFTHIFSYTFSDFFTHCRPYPWRGIRPTPDHI